MESSQEPCAHERLECGGGDGSFGLWPQAAACYLVSEKPIFIFTF